MRSLNLLEVEFARDGRITLPAVLRVATIGYLFHLKNPWLWCTIASRRSIWPIAD